MHTTEQNIQSAVSYLRQKTSLQPVLGLVLGSGLGDFCSEFQQAVQIPFSEIPGFPTTTVEGHTGTVVIGLYHGVPLMALRGRVHYYEGYAQQEITIPIRVMKQLGVETVILTNASGGVCTEFHPGTLMLISDHINFSGSNPLVGPNLNDFGPRFPDMSDIYTKALRQKVLACANAIGVDLQEGVYLMCSGPNYETPAEIRMFRTLGADAVGMSTVPEAIVARHAGMQVVGISCITNMAAGILDQPLSHSEVIETADRVKRDFTRLIETVIDLFA